MNQNIGNLETRETSILGTPLDKFMQFPRTWLHIYPLTCEIPFLLFSLKTSLLSLIFLLLSHFYGQVIFSVGNQQHSTLRYGAKS